MLFELLDITFDDVLWGVIWSVIIGGGILVVHKLRVKRETLQDTTSSDALTLQVPPGVWGTNPLALTRGNIVAVTLRNDVTVSADTIDYTIDLGITIHAQEEMCVWIFTATGFPVQLLQISEHIHLRNGDRMRLAMRVTNMSNADCTLRETHGNMKRIWFYVHTCTTLKLPVVQFLSSRPIQYVSIE